MASEPPRQGSYRFISSVILVSDVELSPASDVRRHLAVSYSSVIDQPTLTRRRYLDPGAANVVPPYSPKCRVDCDSPRHAPIRERPARIRFYEQAPLAPTYSQRHPSRLTCVNLGCLWCYGSGFDVEIKVQSPKIL